MMKTNIEANEFHFDFRKKSSDFHFELNEATSELKAVYKGVDFPSEAWNKKQWELYRDFEKLAHEKLLAEFAFSTLTPHLLCDFVKEIKETNDV